MNIVTHRLRFGVLGGTFDPVHIGHLVIAVELKHALRLDRVAIVPNGDPPHKPDQPLTPARDRIRMLELAIAGRDGLSIDRIEVDQSGPSYTYETLARLSERNADVDFVFLMGEDSLRDLHTWRHPERILELAELGVGCRPDVDVDLDAVYAKLPSARGRVSLVNVPQIGVSSREIRRRVAAGEPISYQTPREIEAYILEHGLYQ